MPTISDAISVLKAKVPGIASLTGRSDSPALAAQEVAMAANLPDGNDLKLTAAERKVLNLAGSGPVETVLSRLDTFEAAFKAIDTDRTGRIDRDERRLAEDGGLWTPTIDALFELTSVRKIKRSE